MVKTNSRLTFVAVLTVRAKTNLFQRSMQANRNINLWQEKTSIYRLSRSKVPKTQQISHYRHARKTGESFPLFNTGVDFSLHNNFANSGSFAKVFVPVNIYNPLLSFSILLIAVFLNEKIPPIVLHDL